MRKHVKFLMMMALVFGAASCSDEKDIPVMPTTPESEQEGMTKTEEPEVPKRIEILTKMASEYDNVSIVDNTTKDCGKIDGGGIIMFEFSSFEGYEVVVTVGDCSICYDVYIPAELTTIKLMEKNNVFLGVCENMHLNKEQIKVPFKKELLGLIHDCNDNSHKHGQFEREYYYKSYNDYMVALYECQDYLQLDINANVSGEEQILSIVISDFLPVAFATINFIQAAK